MAVQSSNSAWGALFDDILDAGAFAGLGYYSGKIINEYYKKSAFSSFFGKVETVNLKSGAICCALFVTIDRIVQAILAKLGLAKKHIMLTAIRIAIDITASVVLYNFSAPYFKQQAIELDVAAPVILTAIAMYSILHIILHSYS